MGNPLSYIRKLRHALCGIPYGFLLLFFGACSLPAPGIHVDKGVISRLPFATLPQLGDVRSITYANNSPIIGEGLWIGGRNGAATLSQDGTPLQIVRFDRVLSHPALLSDGACRIMETNAAWSPVGLMDSTGRTCWIYPRSRDNYPNCMTSVTKVNGQAMFVVGMNGDGGLRFLDEAGMEQSRIEASNVFSVEACDLDGDHMDEILHSAPSGDGIQIRDILGHGIRYVETGFSFFSMVRWPTEDGNNCLIGVDDDRLSIFDPISGQKLYSSKLPDRGGLNVEAVVFSPVSDSSSFLAVVRTIRATWNRSALYVFDGSGELVYHEVFAVSHLALACNPRSSRSSEIVLGAGPRVWKLVGL